ncbi:MAG: DEAD/DEAH box helicase [Chloroflexi bacterium]|nr:DEAD/DEAH box helicase [Chloroflexota bacterium]
MQFNDLSLDPRLLRNVRAMHFAEPTPIQSATIPCALQGRDVLGSAETGTGKTAAYMLPILQNLLAQPGGRDPRVLVLVPTRELALQVADHTKELGYGLNLRVATVYGGVGYAPQDDALRRGVDIVIATPGRLLDQVERRHIRFDALQVLVLDEADRMLDIGFLPDIRRIVRLLPSERQTLLFSATLQSISDLAREVTRDAIRVQVEETVTPQAITQVVYNVPEHLKMTALQNLLSDASMESVLIFARTKHRADRVVRDLERAGIKAAVIHGNRSQSQRVSALEAFRQGRSRVLVATDIAARGIDVAGISHVVNYDVPTQPEDYVHRIGRTGRATAVGQAYTLASPDDSRMLYRIEHILGEKLERRDLESLDYSTPAVKMPSADEIRRYVEANRRKGDAPAGEPARQRRPARRRPSQERARV